METPPSQISSKLIFTAAVATTIVFLYGAIFLSPVFFPPLEKTSLILQSPQLRTYEFALVFLFAFFSNAVIYKVKSDLRLKIAIASFLFCLSAASAYFTSSPFVFYLSRSLVGLGAGIGSATIPCYLSLISPTTTKGTFSSLYSVGLVSGLLIDNLLARFLINNYSIIMLVISLILFILTILVFFCTPLYVASPKESILSLLLNRKAHKSLLIVASFHIIQNLCGINHLTFYAEKIYGPNYCWHQCVNLLIGLILTIISGYLLSLFGRKPLIILSTVVMMLSCLGLYFHILSCFFGYLFIIGFNIGMGNIPYVIMGEVFPAKYVGIGALFATSWNWIGAFISALVHSEEAVLTAGQNSTPERDSAFLVYVGCCGAFIGFVTLFFKETMNLEANFQ